MQTAVDWYANELLGLMVELATNTIAESEYHIKRRKVFEQAKQMEKEQIIHAWREGDNDSMYSPKELDKQAEQYYNETYKSK